MEPEDENVEYYTEAVVTFNRLLGGETTAKLLMALQSVKGIEGVVFKGPTTQPTEIDVGGEKIMLTCAVGSLLIEISDESVADEIRGVCKEVLSMYSEVEVRRYKQPNVSYKVDASVTDIGSMGGKKD
ncbi:MAG: methyl-coenzyme M reductase operon protein D [Halobacteriota archaeon]|nr:methyl-coenzyme M reductase operon protein D [Halobacteriota archaeon]